MIVQAVGLKYISALTINVDILLWRDWLYEHHIRESTLMSCMKEWVLTLTTNLCSKLFDKIIKSCDLVVVLAPSNCIFFNYF